MVNIRPIRIEAQGGIVIFERALVRADCSEGAASSDVSFRQFGVRFDGAIVRGDRIFVFAGALQFDGIAKGVLRLCSKERLRKNKQ
jgi:hypothetical protein